MHLGSRRMAGGSVGCVSVMERVLGVIFWGGLFVAGYVLINGLNETYELFGASGSVLSGGAAFIGALAATAAVFCLRAGIREGVGQSPPVSGRTGMLDYPSRVRREYHAGFITAAVVLGVAAIAILMSGMS